MSCLSLPRLIVLLGLCCGLPAPLHAATVIAAFDMPVAFQEGTQYLLNWRSTIQGVVGGGQEILTVLTAATCQSIPVPQRTSETLCGETRCLAPGEYSFKVRALRGQELSDWSNEVDADLRSTTPCAPVVVRPPAALPDKPSPAVPIAGGLTAAAFLALGRIPPPPLPNLPNMGCVSWKVTGVCLCNPTTPCLTVEYWEPRWLIETLKHPGETAIAEFAPLLNAALGGATGLLGGGGAANVGGQHTNIHYTEAHVWSYPQVLGGPCTACAPTPQLALHYASELDAATWRTAVAVPSPLDLLLKVGTWGPLYPRHGKAIHGSEPVSSGLITARAMDIAFQPIGTPPNTAEVHVVVQPTGGWSRCFQLAYPRQTPCIVAGTPPPLWEWFTLSPRGTYIWIIWTKRTCCVSPNATTCGLTLLGRQGENLCLLPNPPTP